MQRRTIVIKRTLNEKEMYNIAEGFCLVMLDAKYDRRF